MTYLLPQLVNRLGYAHIASISAGYLLILGRLFPTLLASSPALTLREVSCRTMPTNGWYISRILDEWYLPGNEPLLLPVIRRWTDHNYGEVSRLAQDLVRPNK